MVSLDVYFFTVLNKDLEYTSNSFLDHLWKFDLTAESTTEVMVTIEGMPFKRALLYQFKPHTRISNDAMSIFLLLLRMRDIRICSSHREVNEDLDAYCERKSSFFFDVAMLESLCDGDFEYLANVDLAKTHQVFFIVKHASDVWTILILDCSAKSIFFVSSSGQNGIADAELWRYRTGLARFVARHFGIGYDAWPWNPCPGLFIEPLENDFDGGIYVMILLYSLAHGSPAVIRTSYIEQYRRNIAYWIMNEQLPI